MFTIIGMVIVFGSVIGGYLLEHGNLHVLFQPVELLIIAGAAFGAFLIGTPIKIMKAVLVGLIGMFKGKTFSKQDYMDMLMLLGEIFVKIRKEGLVSIEADVEKPDESKIFTTYPKILADHHVIDFIADTLRTVMTTGMGPHELEALLDVELEAHHEEMLMPAQTVSNTADGLPGLGIVAAVMGVVITMGKINEPPAVLGQSIGAALVGTFLGVLLCYGFVGPMGRKMESAAHEQKEYMGVIKIALVAYAGGVPPQIAIEFGRRVVPGHVKPSFLEVEESFRQLRGKK